MSLRTVYCGPQRSGRIVASADESAGGSRTAFERRNHPAGGAISGLLARFHDGYTDSEIAILQSYLRKTKEAALSYPCFDVTVSMGSQKPRNEQGDQNASTDRKSYV